jgi:5-methylcytosine-specific restriction endonuclease McrA
MRGVMRPPRIRGHDVPVAGNPQYKTAVYRLNRQAVLAASDGRCAIRGPGCTGVATSVDHRVALALGGGHDIGNLVPACAHCNCSGGRRIALARRATMGLGRRSRRW